MDDEKAIRKVEKSGSGPAFGKLAQIFVELGYLKREMVRGRSHLPSRRAVDQTMRDPQVVFSRDILEANDDLNLTDDGTNEDETGQVL